MQGTFCFFSEDIARWHRLLAPMHDGVVMLLPRLPLAQLIKSIISSRTPDAVSQAAFDRLEAGFRNLAELADALPSDVERLIADVTFASDKAVNVVGAMQHLRASRYGFDLDPLRKLPVSVALNFLEQLPGVGRKVAASTLNASTLAMPVMIVDTHVLRVLERLGAVRLKADNRVASEAITAAMFGWSAADFLDYHVSMKRLGQLICHHDRPECSRCPLTNDCPKVGVYRAPISVSTTLPSASQANARPN